MVKLLDTGVWISETEILSSLESLSNTICAVSLIALTNSIMWGFNGTTAKSIVTDLQKDHVSHSKIKGKHTSSYWMQLRGQKQGNNK